MRRAFCLQLIALLALLGPFCTGVQGQPSKLARRDHKQERDHEQEFEKKKKRWAQLSRKQKARYRKLYKQLQELPQEQREQLREQKQEISSQADELKKIESELRATNKELEHFAYAASQSSNCGPHGPGS